MEIVSGIVFIISRFLCIFTDLSDEMWLCVHVLTCRCTQKQCGSNKIVDTAHTGQALHKDITMKCMNSIGNNLIQMLYHEWTTSIGKQSNIIIGIRCINFLFVNVRRSSFPIILCGWLVLTLTGSYSRFTQDIVLGKSDTDFGASEVYQSRAHIGYVPGGNISVHHQVELHSRIARPNHNEWHKEWIIFIIKQCRGIEIH